MERDFETTLDLCLEAVKQGKSLEECLALYPEWASQLEPLLRVAADLKHLPKPEPRPEAIRAALVKMGQALPKAKAKRVVSPILRWPAKGIVWPRPVAIGVIAMASLLVLFLWGIGSLSARSLPGHLLYPLKLTTEKVRFVLTRQPERRAELRLTFADRRLNELLKGVEEKGSLDPVLLQSLLREAELALDEARPTPEGRFRFFLTKLEHFNAYQQAVFEEISPKVPPEDSQLLQKAISVCEQRHRWMMQMRQPMHRGMRMNRSWGPGCRWW